MFDSKISEQRSGAEIAIIGMAGRFPGAPSIGHFWDNLKNGVESVTFFTQEELVASAVDPAALESENYVSAAAVLDDVEFFDADFFGFTPKEAEVMDPQHRLFLECSWEALENAGYDAETYKEDIGVFCGARANTYLLNIYMNPDLVRSLGAFHIGLGNDLAFLSTRVSYKLNLTGPSCSVHTACSTSLVAVHLACQSLLVDECQMALAGGIAVNVPQKTGYMYQKGGILSPDGHCRAFDETAQGTIFGSGVGIVVLKRLEDALVEGDQIHAIIKGTAINNDGASKASFTAPSVRSQARVISEAMGNAEVESDSISYVECHGTGTALGDAIEVRALAKAFGNGNPKSSRCVLGSVKTNFGHLDAAAGIAGLIKTVLALKHEVLPPTLHFEKPNPKLELEKTPFYVNNELRDWKADLSLRRAGVSSFGIGGTNAHVVLEQAPAVERTRGARPQQLVVLSAKTESALEAVSLNLSEHLEANSDLSLGDVAYTLAVGRQGLSYRRITVCSNNEEAVGVLKTADSTKVLDGVYDAGEPGMAFMFPGQGAQYVNMGRELYKVERVFKDEVDQCAEVLRPHLSLDIRDILYPPESKGEIARKKLDQTGITQPALFVVEYGMAKLWKSWGVEPKAMIGHSIGEYVAACLGGIFTLEDALTLVAARGRMMQDLRSGAMLAVRLSESDATVMVDGELSLAAVNAVDMCVLSGSEERVQEAEQELTQREVPHRRVATSHAFHSGSMDLIIEPFVDLVSQVKLHPLRIPYVSNVTGGWMTAEDSRDPMYWGRHLRETVRFAKGVETLSTDESYVLLEVGPGATLSRVAKRHSSWPAERVVLNSLGRRGVEGECGQMLEALGRLWLAGTRINWSGFYAQEGRRRVSLPTYPFERQRFWIEPQGQVTRTEDSKASLEKSESIDEWFYTPSWREAPTSRVVMSDGAKRSKDCLIVFLDSEGLGTRLMEELRAEDYPVIAVREGEGFGRFDERVYEINPESPEDYEALVVAVEELGEKPATIVHMWNVERQNSYQYNPDLFRQTQVRGLYSLLFLARAIKNRELMDPVDLWLVSNGAQAVESGDTEVPEVLTLVAGCKVVAQENPHIRCHSVDVVVPQDGTRDKDLVVKQLIGEIGGTTPDVEIAYRGEQRWVRMYEAVDVEREASGVSLLRNEGVYLITGGLGSVGVLLAEHLARTRRARLVLTSRSSVPRREEWDSWLENHDEEDDVTRRIRKVQELESLGAAVVLATADVSNQSQMDEVVRDTVREFGQLNGILHAAGITSGESIYKSGADIEPREADLQFQPKAYGTYVLESIAKEVELDFCLLFSSNAAVLGGIGYAAYAAANQFMDSFASLRRDEQEPVWISANWDPWPEETKKYQEIKTSVDRYAMTRDEGVQAFEKLMSLRGGQFVVSTGNLPARYDLWVRRSSDAKLAQKPGAEQPRPRLKTTYMAPRNEVEGTIAGIWQQVLGIGEVGVQDNFFDLGGHSLLMIMVQGKLRDKLGREIPMLDLFKYPTIDSLAEYLSQEVGDQQRLLEGIDERAKLQAEAIKRRRAFRRGEDARQQEVPAHRITGSAFALESEGEEKDEILRLLAEISEKETEDGEDTLDAKAWSTMVDEEMRRFAERLVERLRDKVESILYYPHPFTRGGFVVVFEDDKISLFKCLADAYVDAPPDIMIYCLRPPELRELSYPGLFVPPDVNGKPHLPFWLKYKGELLYGQDVREDVPMCEIDPRVVLAGHLHGCVYSMRGLILRGLMNESYLSLVQELDRQLRYLMGTALLVYGQWDVNMETIPDHFFQFFASASMKRTFKEFCGLCTAMEAMERVNRRDSAFQAAWYYESFLRQLRRHVS